MSEKMQNKNFDNAEIKEYKKCFLMTFPDDDYRPTVLHLQGSAFDRGEAHGYLLADKITRFFGEYFTPIAAFLGGWNPLSGIPPSVDQLDNGRKFSLKLANERCIPSIKEKEPLFWEEIEGIYHGLKIAKSPLTWEDVIVGNCMPEASWVLSNCSNFAAWNKATTDGKLIHGVNLDEETFDVLQNYVELMVVKPEKGNSFLGMHLMGNISPNSWMNDKKMSYGEMTCNSVNVVWPQIPHLMHGRKVAQFASSVEEAYFILEETGGTTGWANLISYAKGSNSIAVDIELAGKEITIRYEDPQLSNVIWQTNTFRCYPGNQGYEGYNTVKGQVSYWEQVDASSVPDYIDPSLKWNDVDSLEKWQRNVVCPRYNRYEEILKEAYGKIDIVKAIEIQSDEVFTTERMKGKIQLSPSCKHFFGIERPIYSNKVYSVYSCIFIPEIGEAWISWGNIPAQKGSFWRFNLQEHLELLENI